jgi:hypothetical protein
VLCLLDTFSFLHFPNFYFRLLLKAFVPVFVIAYYIILEKYDQSELKTDHFIIYFVQLVVFWHFFSRVIRSAFDCVKNQYAPVAIFLVILAALFIFKIVWIFTFSINVKREIYWRRLIFEITYVVMQIVNGTNLGEMSQDFWYFLAD